MAHKHCLEAVNRMMKDINSSSSLFEGKAVSFIVCFRQILPVIKGGCRSEIVHGSMKASNLFRRLRILRLTENMRLQKLRNDPNSDPSALQFSEFLLRLGEGRLEQNDMNDVQLPSYVNTSGTLSYLCSSVFLDIGQHWRDPDWLPSRAVFVTKNVKLEEINDMVGSRIPGEFKTLKSADSVRNHDQQAQISYELRYAQDLLNQMDAGSSMPDHKMTLKKGYIVMLLCNLRPNKGHVNRARYVIENMTDNVLHLKSVTGVFKGEHLALPRVKYKLSDDNFPIPGFTRKQFPVRTCFAMTTNKPQGQSIRGRLGIDLTDKCFFHGQLYVAMSRITDPRNLYICCESNEFPRTTKNIVFRETLN